MSLVEILVAFAVIGVLLALLLPAIQNARAAARRTVCQNHLHQLGLAAHAYVSTYDVFPIGRNWRYPLLPFLDQTALFNDPRWQATYQVGADYNENELGRMPIPGLVCPDDPAPERIGNGGYWTNYGGCQGFGYQKYGPNGILTAESGDYYVSPAAVTDGLSNTALFSEILHSDNTTSRMRAVWKVDDSFAAPTQIEPYVSTCDSVPPDPVSLGWTVGGGRGGPWFDGYYSGYNHMLPPNRPACNTSGPLHGVLPPSSFHAQGVNLIHGDCHSAFINQDIDAKVWRALGTRDSSEVQ